MKVFSAYATKEDKISYAGYEYCDTLRDINYEDIISFVFMKDRSVVYYIDALVPRAFDIQSLDENTVKISLSSGVSATVNSSEIYLIDNWGYNASFSETTFENRPYFDVVYLENSSVMLSLLNDK